MANFNKDKFDSVTVEWETPLDFFAPLNEEFNFTLDVAATQLNKKVERCFTLEDNGLDKSWENEICWMNPPYGREMTQWLLKAQKECLLNRVTTVCLIPARTNTSWWHNICLKASEIRFVLGRPKFGGAKHGLPFPLAIIIFAPHSEPCKSKINLVKVFELAVKDKDMIDKKLSASVSGIFMGIISFDKKYKITLNLADIYGQSFLQIDSNLGSITQKIDYPIAKKLANLYDGVDDNKIEELEDYLLSKFGEEILFKEDNN